MISPGIIITPLDRDELIRPRGEFLMDGGVTAGYWYGELAPQGAATLIAGK